MDGIAGDEPLSAGDAVRANGANDSSSASGTSSSSYYYYSSSSSEHDKAVAGKTAPGDVPSATPGAPLIAIEPTPLVTPPVAAEADSKTGEKAKRKSSSRSDAVPGLVVPEDGAESKRTKRKSSSRVDAVPGLAGLEEGAESKKYKRKSSSLAPSASPVMADPAVKPKATSLTPEAITQAKTTVAVVGSASAMMARSGISRDRAGSVRYGLTARTEAIPQAAFASKGLKAIPDQIFEAVFFRELFFSRNMLTAIDDRIANLSNARLLDLSYNAITAIPDAVTALTALEKLLVIGNPIASWPADMKALRELIVLEASLCSLGPSLPDSFAHLTTLMELGLKYNRLTVLPGPVVANWMMLNRLELTGNSLTQLCPEITSLASLMTLNLDENCLTCLPDELGALPSLIALTVKHNQLTALPASLFRCSTLTKLDAEYNAIAAWPEPPADAAWPGMLGLADLQLGFNKLTGLPLALRHSRKLTRLELDANLLADMPDLAAQASSLQTLNMACNRIRALPDSMRAMTALLDLSLAGNLLSDSASLGGLSALESLGTLNLCDNPLADGLLPDALAPLVNLEELEVAGTGLTRLPGWLVEFEMLDRLNIGRNALTTIEPDLLNAFVERLSFLCVSNNPLAVDVSTLEAYDWSAIGELIADVQFGEQQPHAEMLTHSVKPSVAFGHASMRGRRDTMEDTVAAVSDLFVLPTGEACDYYAVFDGHAGAKTAQFCACMLHGELVRALAAQAEQGAVDVCTAMQAAVDSCEVLLRAEFSRRLLDAGGATAVVLVWCSQRAQLWAFNVGDARAVLSVGGRVTSLTADHKPTVSVEVERVRAAGGYVTPDGRVSGVIAVSRAIGDFLLKPLVCSTLASTHQTLDSAALQDTCAFVILACDGIWDVMSSEQAAAVAQADMLAGRAGHAAARIRDLAYAYGSGDNLSVVVVRLQ